MIVAANKIAAVVVAAAGDSVVSFVGCIGSVGVGVGLNLAEMLSYFDFFEQAADSGCVIAWADSFAA